jgi:hypothetical protein
MSLQNTDNAFAFPFITFFYLFWSILAYYSNSSYKFPIILPAFLFFFFLPLLFFFLPFFFFLLSRSDDFGVTIPDARSS